MPEEKKMTKKEAGWKKQARIEACNTCKHYRRLGEYGEKLTCGKFGFRTKAFSVRDHFEMDA